MERARAVMATLFPEGWWHDDTGNGPAGGGSQAYLERLQTQYATLFRQYTAVAAKLADASKEAVQLRRKIRARVMEGTEKANADAKEARAEKEGQRQSFSPR